MLIKQKELIQKLNEKDKRAFKLFFKAFYPSLCLFVSKLSYGNDSFEDIAQEAFIFYWENHKPFQSIVLLKGYLYSVAKNKIFNDNKLKHIHNRILGETEEETEKFIEEIIIEEETYRILYEAISNLPQQSRKIIELSLQGYKNKEIAEQLDVSVNTIKTLKRNAFRKLRENLDDRLIIALLLLYMDL
ncbi:MAG: sigma-70 family RNA polymerase sigma factor [Chlorobi bacterium]|nr:sigma-70 family RNA polymerase sigma factor [Chlorobiota bacterium]